MTDEEIFTALADVDWRKDSHALQEHTRPIFENARLMVLAGVAPEDVLKSAREQRRLVLAARSPSA